VKRRFRLNKDNDFKRVRQFGRTFSHPLIVLIIDSNENKISRVGIIVSKALGNAVNRNRIKRQVRACMASMLEQISGAWDMVLIPRPAISGSDFSTIEKALQDVLRRSGLMD
jgi:ribonuclease P protein component